MEVPHASDQINLQFKFDNMQLLVDKLKTENGSLLESQETLAFQCDALTHTLFEVNQQISVVSKELAAKERQVEELFDAVDDAKMVAAERLLRMKNLEELVEKLHEEIDCAKAKQAHVSVQAADRLVLEDAYRNKEVLEETLKKLEEQKELVKLLTSEITKKEVKADECTIIMEERKCLERVNENLVEERNVAQSKLKQKEVEYESLLAKVAQCEDCKEKEAKLVEASEKIILLQQSFEILKAEGNHHVTLLRGDFEDQLRIATEKYARLQLEFTASQGNWEEISSKMVDEKSRLIAELDNSKIGAVEQSVFLNTEIERLIAQNESLIATNKQLELNIEIANSDINLLEQKQAALDEQQRNEVMRVEKKAIAVQNQLHVTIEKNEELLNAVCELQNSLNEKDVAIAEFNALLCASEEKRACLIASAEFIKQDAHEKYEKQHKLLANSEQEHLHSKQQLDLLAVEFADLRVELQALQQENRDLALDLASQIDLKSNLTEILRQKTESFQQLYDESEKKILLLQDELQSLKKSSSESINAISILLYEKEDLLIRNREVLANETLSMESKQRELDLLTIRYSSLLSKFTKLNNTSKAFEAKARIFQTKYLEMNAAKKTILGKPKPLLVDSKLPPPRLEIYVDQENQGPRN